MLWHFYSLLWIVLTSVLYLEIRSLVMLELVLGKYLKKEEDEENDDGCTNKFQSVFDNILSCKGMIDIICLSTSITYPKVW